MRTYSQRTDHRHGDGRRPKCAKTRALPPFAIAKAHWMFESTHPFSDGNGRIGRLVMFKELL
ncbi:Fic family protein [Bifidobacterium longum]|uniref:Fic family protein n=1 Tax=Bifidobacterium longum TaxID=216816 RepID=UPI00389A4F1D